MIIGTIHAPIEKSLVKINFIKKLIFVGSVPNKTACKSE